MLSSQTVNNIIFFGALIPAVLLLWIALFICVYQIYKEYKNAKSGE